MSNETILSLKDVSKSFGEQLVLRSVNADIAKGDVVTLVGSSGGGKTTMLRCMNLLETPSAGRIEFDGQVVFDGRPASSKDLVALRRRIGMVFQRFHLFPNLTAIENVMLPMTSVVKLSEEEALERASALLSRVGLGKKLLARPDTMSGGEQQRTAIARALGLQPTVLLFDEPTSALDPESTGDVLNVMKSLAGDGMTMVIVTHEVQFALDVADRMLFFDAGKIVADGKPHDVVTQPSTPRAAQFFSSFSRHDQPKDI